MNQGLQPMRHRASPPLAVALLITMPALADDTKASAATPRQITHCMMKRLRADRGESYRDALKNCKQELDAIQPERAVDTAHE